MLAAACENELSLLCPGTRGAAAVRCLRDNDEGLMTDCRRALAEMAQREASERAERAAREAAAEVPAAKIVPSRLAMIVGAAGSVFVHLSGRPDDQLVPISSGVPVEEGDSVVVAGGPSSAQLSLDGKVFVALSSGTELALTSLSLAGTELGLEVGSLAAKIDKLAQGEALQVRTPAAVAAVRGTELLVEQDEESGPSLVGVVDEGRVEVSAGGKTVVLGPRQETSAAAGAAPLAPRSLTALAVRAAAFASVRTMAAAAAKAWKSEAADRRQAARERLFSAPPRARAAVVAPRRGAGGHAARRGAHPAAKADATPHPGQRPGR